MNGIFNLRLLLVVAITGLVLTATLGVSLLHMAAFENYARDEAARAIERAAHAVRAKAERLLKPAADIVRYVSARNAALAQTRAKTDRSTQFSAFLRSVGLTLRSNPHIYAAYMGYADGSFVIEVRDSERLRKSAKLPPDIKSQYLRLERNTQSNKSVDVWSHMQNGKWQSITQPVSDYEPRDRPWYRLGKDRGQPVWTRLYRFFVDDGYGMTLVAALRNPDKQLAAVVSVDVRLEDLTSFIRNLNVSANGFAFIARPNGELIAHPALVSQILDYDIDTNTPTLFDVRRADNRDVRLFEAMSKGRSSSVQIDVGGETILGRRLALGNLPGFDGHLFIGAPLSDFTAAADRVANRTLLIAAGMIILVLIVGIWIARAVARPVRDAASAMTAVARLELQDSQLEKRSSLAEIAMLNASVSTMQSALRSFVRYVPRDVVRDLLELRQPLALGGGRREVTILFTDIESFTTLMETEQDEGLIDGLADYFDVISSVITAHGGTVDKFIGDSVMAIWGAPRDDAEHTRHACDAVVEIDRQLEALNARRERSGAPRLTTRYGLHRGYTFVGNVGARERFGYTALGDVVNIAARLEGANKEAGTRALVSQAVAATAGGDHQFRAHGKLQLRGRSAPIEAFEFKLQGADTDIVELSMAS